MPDDGPAAAHLAGVFSAGMGPDSLAGPATGETTGGDAMSVAGGHLCPWCSVDLSGQEPDRCPACGARLTADPDASIPGVTTVDPAAVRRAASWQPAPKRRLLGFLDPEPMVDSGVRPSSVEALAPPSPEVRLEMERLRAELDAAVAAELEVAAAAEPGAAGGVTPDDPGRSDGPGQQGRAGT